MAKRITLARLRLLDEATRESNVRKIEMIVDGILDFEPGFKPQFFSDAGLYHFGEAYRYLYEFVESKGKLTEERQKGLSELRELIEKLKNRV
jgi:hypothetical protein